VRQRAAGAGDGLQFLVGEVEQHPRSVARSGAAAAPRIAVDIGINPYFTQSHRMWDLSDSGTDGFNGHILLFLCCGPLRRFLAQSALRKPRTKIPTTS
jgi:hypothetical protein